MGSTPASLALAADRSGCRLVKSFYASQANGAPLLVGDFSCPDVTNGDPWASARLLKELADQEALEPETFAEAAPLARAGADTPRVIHAYVRRTSQFRKEPGEIFASSAVTKAVGFADCDDAARRVYVLAKALGIGARFAFFVVKGEPVHVVCLLDDDGVWRWAETTVPAAYGEHPLQALKRLGIARSDIAGDAVIMTEDGRFETDPCPPPTLGPADGSSGEATAMGSFSGDQTESFRQLDGGFFPTLVQLSRGIGIDPFDATKLFMSESGLNPRAQNFTGFSNNGSAVGINQLAGDDVSPMNHNYFLRNGLSVAQYLQLSATEQLPFAFAYWRDVMRGHGLSNISGRDLYWLNFLPALYVPGASDDHVIVTSASRRYAPNRGLDHGGKGAITAGDLQESLDAQERNNPHDWPILAQAIAAAGGGSPSFGSGGLPAGLVAVGLGLLAMLAYYKA